MLGGWMWISWCLVRQSLKLPVIPYQAVFECVSKHVASYPSIRNRAMWASLEVFVSLNIQFKSTAVLFLVCTENNICVYYMRYSTLLISHVFTSVLHNSMLQNWFVCAPVLGAASQFFFMNLQTKSMKSGLKLQGAESVFSMRFEAQTNTYLENSQLWCSYPKCCLMHV